MYFSGMQENDGKGVYPFADDCNRIENGSFSTNAPTPPGQQRPDPKNRQELFRAVELPGAVPIGLAAFRHAHPRPPFRGCRSGARTGVQLHLLRSCRRRHPHISNSRRKNRHGGSHATLDVGIGGALPDREEQDPSDRSDNGTRSLRHEFGLEQLGGRAFGPRQGRRQNSSIRFMSALPIRTASPLTPVHPRYRLLPTD